MADDRRQGARLVRIDDLRRCLAIAFERLRLTSEDAEALGGLLVDSELRGHPGHGVAALEVLTRLYRAVMVPYLPAISTHIGGDPPQPWLVVEGLSKGFSLAEGVECLPDFPK